MHIVTRPFKTPSHSPRILQIAPSLTVNELAVLMDVSPLTAHYVMDGERPVSKDAKRHLVELSSALSEAEQKALENPTTELKFVYEIPLSERFKHFKLPDKIHQAKMNRCTLSAITLDMCTAST